MKRINTMVGTIMGTVANAYQLVVNLISAFALFGLLADISSGTSMAGVLPTILLILLFVAVIVVAFILTCRIFKYMNAAPETYKSKKGLIIAAIVFNFLVVILLCIGGFEGTAFGIIMNVLCLLVLVATNVHLIVDMCLEKKRVAEMNKKDDSIPAEAPEVAEAVKVAEEKEQPNLEDKKNEEKK